MQPLVKTARDLYEAQQKENKATANKGLVFERFYNGYDARFAVDKTSDTNQLRDLVGKCGDTTQLSEATKRRIQLVTSLNGEFGVFKTDWHFVTGMGNSHPAENGFSWHTTLGTPYLPGSSVKGLLRAWMEVWVYAGNEQAKRKQVIDAWFGRDAKSEGDNDAGKAGDLIFFDALPIEQPTVTLDIMTPHMGKWYEQGGDTITAESQPGDWHSPVPINFLVTKDARFVFAIAPRTAAAKAYAVEAMEYLKEALAWLGAGAKTAAGYGHMSFDEQDTLKRFKQAEEAQEAAVKEQQLASMSEEERKIIELADRKNTGEGKGSGSGCTLAADLSSLCDEAVTWPSELQQQLHTEALLLCKHLVIDVKKNKKWKERLNQLKPSD